MNKLFYAVTWPMSLLPYAYLQAIGKALGSIVYHCVPEHRKRCLSNIALVADELGLSQQDIRRTAKESLQNTMICVMEYVKLAHEKNMQRIARCENPQTVDQLVAEGKGVVFFSGHQANWEIIFLEGSSRMSGVAIGRPLRNKILYDFILSVRQKFGGKVVPPQNALKEGVRAIKQGKFFGIVGDQAAVKTGYSSLFFGRKAWTSPLAAILAYRLNAPIVVATIKRQSGRYIIHYQEPIYPDCTQSLKSETDRMMQIVLQRFQNSVRENLGQWLWQHNRWKQITVKALKRKYRYDCFAIALPKDAEKFRACIDKISQLYFDASITLFAPEGSSFYYPNIQTHYYKKIDDILIEDLRFKVFFDFIEDVRIAKHYLKFSVSKVFNFSQVEKMLP